MNIFHTNINGLETKFENLHEYISSTSLKMDIAESLQKDDNLILKTVIEGYVNCLTPTNLSKGGTALHINDKFDSFERMDLKIQNDNFETTWVEIVNKLSRNIVLASIYRHPRYNLQNVEKELTIVIKEDFKISY